MEPIGLKRGNVRVLPYCPQWPVLFEQEKQRLVKAFGGAVTEIEHIGSTSVPGLAAKPLIDIMAAIDHLDSYKQFIQPLARLGYEYMPNRVFSDRAFFPKGPRDNRTHHLNLVLKDSHQWRQAILFRNILRKHAATRRKYEQLKLELAEKYPENRMSYTKAKDEFIKSVLESAY